MVRKVGTPYITGFTPGQLGLWNRKNDGDYELTVGAAPRWAHITIEAMNKTAIGNGAEGANTKGWGVDRFHVSVFDSNYTKVAKYTWYYDDKSGEYLSDTDNKATWVNDGTQLTSDYNKAVHTSANGWFGTLKFPSLGASASAAAGSSSALPANAVVSSIAVAAKISSAAAMKTAISSSATKPSNSAANKPSSSMAVPSSTSSSLAPAASAASGSQPPFLYRRPPPIQTGSPGMLSGYSPVHSPSKLAISDSKEHSAK